MVASTATDTGDKSEEDNQDVKSTPKLRRGPARAVKMHMDYMEMISEENKKSTDCEFLGSVDPYDIHTLSFSSASILLTKDT